MTHSLAAPFPWQDIEWKNLVERLHAQNLPHAILLHGIQGLGKRSFAQAFAALLLCEQRSGLDQACQRCRSCKLLQAGSHPDWYVLVPEDESKVIRIDAVRGLIEQMNQTSHQGQFKVVMIAPAEALHISAANALLKTLEEPSAATLFILISEQLQSVLATIRSRCQKIYFKPPAYNAVKNWLLEHLENSDVAAQLFATAEQAPLRALALAKDDSLKSREKFLTELVGLHEKKNDPAQLAHNWLKFSVADIVLWSITIVIDLIRIKMGIAEQINHRPQYHVLVQKAELKKLFYFLDQLYALRPMLSRGNPNTQLTLEQLFINWSSI